MSEVFNQLKVAIARAQRSGVTLYQLAAEADLSPNTLHLWMDGKTNEPRMRTLMRVADVLDKRIELVNGAFQVTDKPKPRTAAWLRQDSDGS